MSRDSFCSGAPVDTGTSSEGQQQQVEDPPTTARFTWTIEQFSRLHPKNHYSDVFTVGGYEWRVLIFPKGNNVDHLSMYLDVADSAALPSGWRIHTQFSLSVVNQIPSKDTVRKETQHHFNAREGDWGFTSFMPLVDLYDPSRGYIVNDTCIVEAEVAVHKKRLKEEQEEMKHKKKEKAEAHLYTIIKVVRDVDIRVQIGRDIYFDLVDHDKVRSFWVQKQMPFNLFKDEVAKEFGIPVQFQRFWFWARRQNDTYRPHRPLTPQEEAQSVGLLREHTKKLHIAELKLFLEVEIGVDLQPLPLPAKAKEDILIFFKLYDPEKEQLRYVGRLFVKTSGKPSEILSKLNEMAGFHPDEETELYEEIKYEPSIMCEPIDKKNTFRYSQLEDGDIICYQKSPSPGSKDQYRYPDVPSFLEYVHNRQFIHFRSLEKPKEDDFCLELSKLFTYDDVVERVARQLGLDDPSKIHLTSHNCYSQQPKPPPIKYRGVEHLSDMLVYNQTSNILYYEVLDIPLPELQCLKTLKVAFHHATKDEVVIYTIRLPKNSIVGDVINDLKAKADLSHPNTELRLLEVFYHKIYKIFPASEKIENINDQYWTLRAEEIPEEEKNLGPNDRLIYVYHFMKDPNQNQMQVQNFGEPFLLVIHEGEILAEVKARIQKKLQVPDEEFSKWKFAFLSLGRPEYLQDSDVVSSRFQRRDVYGSWEQYLGLEHSDTTPKRLHTANQNRHTSEKPAMGAPSSSPLEEIPRVVPTAPPEDTPSAKVSALPASIPTAQTTVAPASATKDGPTTVMAAPDDKAKQLRDNSTLLRAASSSIPPGLSSIPPGFERSFAAFSSSINFQCLEDGRHQSSYRVGDDESVFMDCTTTLKLAENSLLLKDHSALKKVPYEGLVNAAVWYNQMLSSVNMEMRHRASSMSELEVVYSQKLQASEKALEDTEARLNAALSQNTELNKSLAEEKAARKVAEEKATAAEEKAIDIEGMLAAERERGEKDRSILRSQIKSLFDQL